MGITVPKDELDWSVGLCDDIYNDLEEKFTNLYAKKIILDEVETETDNLKNVSSIVLLNKLEDDRYVNVNKWLVDNGMATFDKNAKHLENVDFVEYEYDAGNRVATWNSNPNNINSDSIGFPDDSLEVFTEGHHTVEDYLKFFNLPLDAFQHKNETFIVPKSEHSDNTTKQKQIPLLKYETNVPKASWHQTQELVVLSIVAGENPEYSLKVTSDTLIYV